MQHTLHRWAHMYTSSCAIESSKSYSCDTDWLYPRKVIGLFHWCIQELCVIAHKKHVSSQICGLLVTSKPYSHLMKRVTCLSIECHAPMSPLLVQYCSPSANTCPTGRPFIHNCAHGCCATPCTSAAKKAAVLLSFGLPLPQTFQIDKTQDVAAKWKIVTSNVQHL